MQTRRFLGLLWAVLVLIGCGQTPPPETSIPDNSISITETRQLSPVGDQGATGPAARPGLEAQTVSSGSDNGHLLLGNPSRAGRDVNNFLAERPQHSLSYNKSNGGPNWVSWHLEQSDLGPARRSSFWPDPLLPPDLQIRPNDYRGSGYDRGHVCPSGDRTRDSESNRGTFVMSNMLPQAPALNQHVWKDLEEYERYLAKGGNELYIVAGGTGAAERIGNGKINVPTVCWKILVVLPNGSNDLARINAQTRVIAVAMPNRDREEIADSKWADWITTVAALEKTTGYDFLSALPDDVERALEQKKDSGRAASGPSSGTRSARQTSVRRIVSAPTTIGTLPPPVRTDDFSNPPPTFGSTSPSAGARRVENAPGQTTQTTVETTQTTETVVQAPAADSANVWVNTRSGIYHYPGARWYGNTKEGSYMPESQALANGYRAARNGQ